MFYIKTTCTVLMACNSNIYFNRVILQNWNQEDILYNMITIRYNMINIHS